MGTTTSRQERLEVLRELLSSMLLRSQAEVTAALAERGVACTQATVSRDLDAVGAVKVRGADGQLGYRLRADVMPRGSARVSSTLRQFVTEVSSSANIVVLRTPPACAQPVASAIDQAGMDEVIATIAGDDTVLVVTAEGTDGAALANDFRANLAR